MNISLKRTQSEQQGGRKLRQDEEFKIDLSRAINQIQKTLAKREDDLRNEIEKSVKANNALMDPSSVENVMDLIDQNLEKVLMYSDIHRNISEEAIRKKEMDEIKQHA